jgi:hypothetical protein
MVTRADAVRGGVARIPSDERSRPSWSLPGSPTWAARGVAVVFVSSLARLIDLVGRGHRQRLGVMAVTAQTGMPRMLDSQVSVGV